MDREEPIDASALSVIVPVRIDGPDRAENLRTITRYCRRYFTGCEMILVEVDGRSRIDPAIKAEYDRVVLVETEGRFSRSGAMNRGLLESSRPVVAFYDADVLVHPRAATDALHLIEGRRFPLVLPFNGVFLDIKGAKRSAIVATLDTGRLAADRVSALRGDPEIEVRFVNGGVLFADRQVIIGGGGFNANMISYGWEDAEILRRFEKLGYYRTYIPYNLIHLDHARGVDSVKNEYYDSNQNEFQRVSAMKRRDLMRYTVSDLCPKSGLAACAANEQAGRLFQRGPLSIANARSVASKLNARLVRRQ